VTQTIETDTTPTTAQKRAERRRIRARNRKITKRAKELRRAYEGRDDLDVPSAQQIVDRYATLRDSGRLPADIDELDGTVAVVRRHHYDSSATRYETAVAICVGFSVMLLVLRITGASELPALVFVTLIATSAAYMVWGSLYDSKRSWEVAYRAHADVLLTATESESPAFSTSGTDQKRSARGRPNHAAMTRGATTPIVTADDAPRMEE
jgi:hypothetical protein